MDPTQLTALFGGSIVITVVATVCGSLLCVVVPLGAVGYFVIRRLNQGQQAVVASQSWPSTTGTVIRAFAETSSSGDGIISYYPRIIYEYEVDGQRYQGKDLRASDRFMTKGMPQIKVMEIVDQYPAGTQVVVYYNPANPAEAALVK